VRPAALLPGGVGVIERVIPDVGIEVQVLLIPDGISLQEPTEDGIIDARLVVTEPKLR